MTAASRCCYIYASGQSIEIGRSLRELLADLEGDTLDVEVELSYRKRRYAGRRHSLRLVGRRDRAAARSTSTSPTSHPSNCPLRTCRPPTPCAGRSSSSSRSSSGTTGWRICRAATATSSSRCSMPRSSPYASRRLLQALRAALLPAQAQRLKEHRFATVLAFLADKLLILVLHRGRLAQHLQQRLSHLLFVEAFDPNNKLNQSPV